MGLAAALPPAAAVRPAERAARAVTVARAGGRGARARAEDQAAPRVEVVQGRLAAVAAVARAGLAVVARVAQADRLAPPER